MVKNSGSKEKKEYSPIKKSIDQKHDQVTQGFGKFLRSNALKRNKKDEKEVEQALKEIDKEDYGDKKAMEISMKGMAGMTNLSARNFGKMRTISFMINQCNSDFYEQKSANSAPDKDYYLTKVNNQFLN